MTDVLSDFWSGWIIVVTLVSGTGLIWIVFSVYSADNVPHDDEESPVWDDNLREGSNPAPLWWFWLILALLVFSVVYLMLYPGLGSFKGALQWSQGGRLEVSQQSYTAEFGAIRRLIVDAELATLQEDDKLMRSAERIYDRNCAVCHGYDAQGQANLFPNLVDDEWQWGNSPEQIDHSIRLGRNAVMVSWLGPLGGEQGVRNVVDYVKVLGTDAANGHPGQAQYNTFCVACHGIDGAGNVAFGAPNLVDDVWLYGDSDAALYESIAVGRYGQMPAFASRLDDTQLRLLVAWLSPKE